MQFWFQIVSVSMQCKVEGKLMKVNTFSLADNHVLENNMGRLLKLYLSAAIKGISLSCHLHVSSLNFYMGLYCRR